MRKGTATKFTGHEHDGETGYDYHGARYYNSELGRYMNVDPMASQGYGWTTYRYGYDNPVNYTDPTGMLEDFVRTEEGNVQYDSRVTDQGTAEKYYGKNALYREEGHSFEGGRSGKQIVLGKNGHYTSDGVEGVAFDYASIAPESFGLPVAERSSEESFENNSIMAQHFGNGKGFATEGKSMFWSDPEKEYMWANSRAKTQAVNDLIEGMIYETVSILAGGEIINGTFKGMYAGYKYLRTAKAVERGVGVVAKGGNSSAHLSTNSVNLAKQLASEAQMAEKGVTVIGPGRLNAATRLAREYGGNAVDWVKKSSSSFTKNGTTFETHWYENVSTGLRTEFKTKFP